MKVPSSIASRAPIALRQQGHERALVGGDLHHRDVAHRLGLGLHAAQDLVLARAVLDQVGVQLVGERGELAHRARRLPRPSAAEKPHAEPHQPPGEPGPAEAKSSTSGSRSSTAAATATATWSYSSVGSCRRSASRRASQQPSAPSAIPLPPGGDRDAVAERRLHPRRRERAQRPAGDDQQRRWAACRGVAPRPGRKIASASADREQVAEVVVDERARRSSATTRRRPGRRSLRGRTRSGSRPARRSRATAGAGDRRDRRVGPRAGRGAPRRARSRRSAALRRRRSRRPSARVSSSPRRSSFGARLRSRVPQYGHSVTYGLTSEPHFLQTTLSSGELTPETISGGGRGR